MKFWICNSICLIGLFITSWSLSGQNMQLLSYKASNGIEYQEGMQVHLGKGTTPNKDFRYINAQYPGPDGITNLPSQYVGQFLEVIKIRQSGSKKEGYKIYVVCDNGRTNYWVEIEAAIKAGEVVVN